jgi:hypothetical protein
MLSLLFYIAVRPEGDPVTRFEKYMRSVSSLKVDMDLKVSGVKEIGNGYFQAKQPNFVLWVMKWGPSDFSFSSAGDEIVAIEKFKKVYREYGAVGRLFIPESDISSTPEYGFPLPLLSGSLTSLLPNGVHFSGQGKALVEKVPVDVVRAEFTTPSAKVTVQAKVDEKGRLLECVTTYGGGGPSQIRTLTFKNYRANQALSEASFRTPIPKGFTPQTLPADAFPVNFGERMPLDGWKPVSGSGDIKTLAQNKVLFVAIGDPNCEVSVRAAKTVASLAKDVEAKGGISVAICPASSSPQPVYTTIPNFYDPTGKIYPRLRAPGTPMFFLVSPKGLVTRVWYGFDEAQAAEFVKDALEWVDPKKGG